jgi:hypothetical protein
LIAEPTVPLAPINRIFIVLFLRGDK